MGSVEFHGAHGIHGISWIPWNSVGSLEFHGPGTSRIPWSFMASSDSSYGFHGEIRWILGIPCSPWNSMEFRKLYVISWKPLTSMKFYGFHGVLRILGIPWNYELPKISQNSMDPILKDPWLPWNSLELNGIPRKPMDFVELKWNPRNSHVPHEIPWNP